MILQGYKFHSETDSEVVVHMMDYYYKKEKNLQKATLKIKQKYGKNAILKGMNLEEGATTRERNEIIGGHKA